MAGDATDTERQSAAVGRLESEWAVLYTDGACLGNQGWARRWRTNGWMRGREGRAANADLWEALLELCARHEASFEWIRGHAGDRENERCDRLSVIAAQQTDLPEDTG